MADPYRAPTHAPATPRQVLEQLERVAAALRSVGLLQTQLAAQVAALAVGAGVATEQAPTVGLGLLREVDDFTVVTADSVATSPGIGATPSLIACDLAWTAATNADSGSAALIGGESGSPGIARFSTPSTANRIVQLRRGHHSSGVGAFKFSDVALNLWRVRLNAVSSFGLRLGFSNKTPSSFQIASPGGATGAFFHADTTNEGSDNLFAVTVAGSTATATDLGSSASLGLTAMRLFSIAQTAVGTVVFGIDGTTVATHTTNVPGVSSAAVSAEMAVICRTSSARILEADYYETQSQALTARAA